MGFGMVGLANLLGPQMLSNASAADVMAAASPLTPKSPHFPAKAKRVIHIFANGGPSHVDTFDPKPMLAKLHGKPLPMDNLKTERRTGSAFQSLATSPTESTSARPPSAACARLSILAQALRAT